MDILLVCLPACTRFRQEMTLPIKIILAFGVGLAGGWAARSLGDSPQGAGVKLLEIAMNLKKEVEHWVAVEREHLEDMFAEANSNREPDVSRRKMATNGSGHQGRSGKRRAVSGRRGPLLVKSEERA
jgi:hypothetical protein